MLKRCSVISQCQGLFKKVRAFLRFFQKRTKKGKKMLKKHKQRQNKLEKLKLTGKGFLKKSKNLGSGSAFLNIWRHKPWWHLCGFNVCTGLPEKTLDMSLIYIKPKTRCVEVNIKLKNTFLFLTNTLYYIRQSKYL